MIVVGKKHSEAQTTNYLTMEQVKLEQHWRDKCCLTKAT